ncbi:hypothetical protein FGM00_16150 [Aggregatimonas sangjinii]|uniref:Uncharacterized protein n=1 Tax=Aggregatimonas sangjinii TaxID=2583587 RepID=A0A5B7SS39_9FLAO|nr:hypothetical protein [Aggregatimonas sangjinii]QCX01565.1 hypothetical protein FGM00_16150 [Aggregatimonas sangjinii]
MKTIKHNYILLIIVAFSLTACQKEDSVNVNQDRIFAAYELFYDQNEDLTTAKAVFTFGNRTGTRLTLSEGSSVNFDGKQMTYDELTGAYLSEMAGYKASGTFVFEDLDTGVFTNSVELNPISFDANVPDTIDSTVSYEIGWEGDPVMSNRSTVAATVVPNNTEQTKVFLQTSMGAENVTLTTNKLQEIDPQPGNILLERGTEYDLSEKSSAGGVITARYRTNAKSITIE